MALMYTEERGLPKDTAQPHTPANPGGGWKVPAEVPDATRWCCAGRLGRQPPSASLGQAPWAQLEVPGVPGDSELTVPTPEEWKPSAKKRKVAEDRQTDDSARPQGWARTR